ncbi:MFS transporter [Chloroflexota bacterium]
MKQLRFLKPKPTISEQDIALGLHWFTLEGMTSLGLFSITTSGFLAAFALALGANNLQIGILAALPFLMQILQLPSIWLVEKFRKRKTIALITWLPAQLLWFPMALIPAFAKTPSGMAISLLLIFMAIRGLLAAISNCSWNGWIRDLIPQQMLGQIFSRRLIFSTIAAVAFSMGAAFFVDFWQSQASGQSAIFGYTYVLLFGALFLGLASPVFMALMPEPLMQTVPGTQPSIMARLTTPFRDRNFRQLIQFLLFWGFASNLAIPFFAVYMLQRLGLPLSSVIALSILSQFFNILFLRIWGRFVDRFGSKAVLSLCASLYLLVILGWIFTTMPERYVLTIPLLLGLHIFAGIANAGVTLTVATIGLKLSPKGEATTYLAGASLATNLGAGLGPLCGGLLADFFSKRQLDLTLTWTSPLNYLEVSALSIIGLEFLFGIAFIFGLITLSTLATVREEGAVSREVILESLMFPTREISRPMSSVPGYNLLSNFPFGYLKKIPIPGLDVAVGVTAYQIAAAAKAATLAAVRGRKVTKRLVKSLQSSLPNIWTAREETRVHGVEIARQAARGAMHVVDDKSVAIENLVSSVATSVITASGKAGINPLNGIQGASQGIIQGAIETGSDLTAATIETIEAAKGMAKQSGVSEEAAVVKATVGALEVAEATGPKALESVREALSSAARQEINKQSFRDKDKK